MLLHDFIAARRAEVLRDAASLIRERRPGNPATEAVRAENLPAFLDGVIAGLLRRDGSPARPPARPALRRDPLRTEQYEVDEVVHEYGALCTTIMEVAKRYGQPMSIDDHQALNQALDEGIAADVVAYERMQRDDARHLSAERLGFVAHELRNALHTAALSFQAIRSGRVPSQGVTGAILERSHHRLRELVERLVAQVRLGAGAGVRRDRLSVAVLAQESVSYMRDDAQAKNIDIDIQADQALETFGDRTLLTSALTNLLQNAVKFTPEGGKIAMRVASEDGDRVLIEVEDECSGLDPAIEEAIFTPFFQGGEDRSGLGLGLTIAREIVAAHDGKVTVRNLPGRGCVFVVELSARASAGP